MTDQQNETAQLAKAAKNGELVVVDNSPNALLFDTAKFAQVYRVAQAMATSPLIPEHLRGERRSGAGFQPYPLQVAAANCILVVNVSYRWGLDPYAVAPETYVVRQRLGFQGKLVAAVVNTRADLAGGNLRAVYGEGHGDDLAAVIYGSERLTVDQFPDAVWDALDAYAATEDRKALNVLDRHGVLAIRITVGQAKTDNQMWRTDPEQKLFYSGVAKWARRHRPELMLGVSTDDDLDRMKLEEGTRPPGITGNLAAVVASGSGGSVGEQAAAPDGGTPQPTEETKSQRLHREAMERAQAAKAAREAAEAKQGSAQNTAQDAQEDEQGDDKVNAQDDAKTPENAPQTPQDLFAGMSHDEAEEASGPLLGKYFELLASSQHLKDVDNALALAGADEDLTDSQFEMVQNWAEQRRAGIRQAKGMA